MKRSPFAIAACLMLVGCGYNPSIAEQVRITDTVADVRACQDIGEVTGPFRTTPGDMWGLTRPMREKVVALGGNFLLIERQNDDWSVARGVAYSCPVSIYTGW